jgi:hypothetical protein
MKINYFAVIACCLVSLGLGFVWFNLLFGKVWAKIMHYDLSQRPSSSEMMKSFSLFLFGSLLSTLVLFCLVQLARIVSVFGYVPKGTEPYLVAIVVWIGFYIPQSLNRVSWEKKGWDFVLIHGAYDLVRLVVLSLLLWYWR